MHQGVEGGVGASGGGLRSPPPAPSRVLGRGEDGIFPCWPGGGRRCRRGVRGAQTLSGAASLVPGASPWGLSTPSCGSVNNAQNGGLGCLPKECFRGILSSELGGPAALDRYGSARHAGAARALRQRLDFGDMHFNRSNSGPAATHALRPAGPPGRLWRAENHDARPERRGQRAKILATMSFRGAKKRSGKGLRVSTSMGPKAAPAWAEQHAMRHACQGCTTAEVSEAVTSQ